MPNSKWLVAVGQGNWQQQLENNKQAFTLEFVQRSRFTTAFPTSMTPAQFVDKLFLNAGVTPSASDLTAAVNEFGGTSTTSDLSPFLLTPDRSGQYTSLLLGV